MGPASPFLLALLALPQEPARLEQGASQAPPSVPERMAREDVHAPLERALAYLLERQREDGSWGPGAPDGVLDLGFGLESYYSWKLAAHGLVCMALAAVDETPQRRAALERALGYLCATRIPARPDDWDQDHVWSALYGFVACVELLDDPRFANGEWSERLTERGQAFLAILRRYQADSGGWAYYDDPPYGSMPTWATSFCTALVLPYLRRAQERGWELGPRTLERAIRYVKLCKLPGGAYSYDLTPVTRLSGVEHINLIQGSLGRTQVCNWALVRVGEPAITPDVLREGLEDFFRYHEFLDHVRTRPIPHEGFYANAGYFYFFAHYYAAKVIELLPEAEREGWYARLRPHVVKTQYGNGAASDFLDAAYMVNASTAYLALTLQAGLPQPEVPAPADEVAPPAAPEAAAQAPAEEVPAGEVEAAPEGGVQEGESGAEDGAR